MRVKEEMQACGKLPKIPDDGDFIVVIGNPESCKPCAKIEEFIKSKKPHQICTVNPEFIMTAQKNLKFKELLNKRPNSKIKPLLIDQSFIAGIGNIYAQEACWCAQILPIRLTKSLKEKEINLWFFGVEYLMPIALPEN